MVCCYGHGAPAYTVAKFCFLAICECVNFLDKLWAGLARSAKLLLEVGVCSYMLADAQIFCATSCKSLSTPEY